MEEPRKGEAGEGDEVSDCSNESVSPVKFLETLRAIDQLSLLFFLF